MLEYYINLSLDGHGASYECLPVKDDLRSWT